jgi:hypothetical protein
MAYNEIKQRNEKQKFLSPIQFALIKNSRPSPFNKAGKGLDRC